MPGYNAKPNTAKTEGGLLLRLTYFFYRDCVIINLFSKNEFLISIIRCILHSGNNREENQILISGVYQHVRFTFRAVMTNAGRKGFFCSIEYGFSFS